MRFLCLDCSFFKVDKSKLVPPLDRVNYRMCEQLFGTEYVLEKLGEYEVSFDTGAHFGFADIGKQILGKKQVLINNLWFIGHFYHDGKERNDCGIREGARIVDYPHLKNITRKLPDSCPFEMHGCARNPPEGSILKDDMKLARPSLTVHLFWGAGVLIIGVAVYVLISS